MSVTRSARAIATSGNSSKPVWQKLGLCAWLRHSPDDYWSLCGFDPACVAVTIASSRQFDFGHLFATSRAGLARDLPAAARKLDAGGMLLTSSTGSRSPPYARGEHVRVLYDHENPERAPIDSFMENWLGPLILGGMGLVFSLVGSGIVGAQFRQRKLRDWLVQNGMRLHAKF